MGILRCLVILVPIALPLLVFGAALPEDVGILMILPVGVGWVLSMAGCVGSKRLRDDVVAGRMAKSTARGWEVAYLILFPIGVALTSFLSLGMSAHKSHMSFLLPWAFAFWSCVFAAACIGVHELAMAARLNQAHQGSTPTA